MDKRVAVADGDGDILYLDPAKTLTQCWADKLSPLVDGQEREFLGLCYRRTNTPSGLCREHRCELLGKDCREA